MTLKTVLGAAALMFAGLPGAAQATEVINHITGAPGFESATISWTGHFTNLATNAGRFNMTGTSQPSNRAVSYFTYCVDLLHYISNGSFEIRPLSVIVTDATKRAQITALVTSIDPQITGTTQHDRDISTAVQIAIWEIISETTNTGYSLTTGAFRASGLTSATQTLANGYLAQVVNGGLVAQPNRQVSVLYSPTNQSQLFVTSVPEPVTWMMMILGFGIIGGFMRTRRRRDATAGVVSV